MIEWNQGGTTGSIRRWVRREVRRHRVENTALTKARYSYGLRLLRRLLGERSFLNFLLLYAAFDIAAVAVEMATSTFGMNLFPLWSVTTLELKGLLKDATSYFISAQVGVLGVVSIAVGLVTLIAQRDNSPNDVQIYYRESLAHEVVASSIALLLVLSVQILWPAQFSLHRMGGGDSNAIFKIGLTSLHLSWLTMNLFAMAHFVTASLRFVQPGERQTIRKQYSANHVIPQDMTDRLRSAIYSNGSEGLFSGDDRSPQPMIFFGHELAGVGSTEIEDSFEKPVLLYDVRMRLLRWVLSRWWQRCCRLGMMGTPTRKPAVIFKPSFTQKLRGNSAWFRREGGTPFSSFERFLVRRSFRFRRVPE
jgi:hypothetical protein